MFACVLVVVFESRNIIKGTIGQRLISQRKTRHLLVRTKSGVGGGVPYISLTILGFLGTCNELNSINQ